MFTVLDVDLSNFCSEGAGLLQLVGWVLTIFKIAIPILVIAFGIFDFGKAVTAAKDDEIKKSVKSLMWRAIAGVVIFFIPAIVMMLFRAISDFREIEDDNKSAFAQCEACVLRPWSEGYDAKGNKNCR